VRFRPVRLEDAAFIVWLRHLDRVRGKLGDSAADLAGQECWLNEYFDRPGDCYFIIETARGNPVGTFGVYDVVGGAAECGRYIIRPGVKAAVPASVLGADMMFGPMGLREVRATAVAGNQTILSIDRKLGFRETRVEHAGRNIAGQPVDIIHLVLTPDYWQKSRPRILALARRAEGLIERWDQAQTGPPEWERTLEAVK